MPKECKMNTNDRVVEKESTATSSSRSVPDDTAAVDAEWENGGNEEWPINCTNPGQPFLVIDDCEEIGVNHNNKTVVQCKLCQIKLLKNSFWRHWTTHKKEFKCDLCSSRFINEADLDEHRKQHQGRFYECEQPNCRKKYIYMSDLMRHIQGVHNWLEDQVECSLCDKTFRDKDALKRHRLAHTAEYPHKCQQCPKAFKTMSSLKIHLMSHSGIRPYQCSACDQKFTRKDKLAIHEKRHRKNVVLSSDVSTSIDSYDKCVHVTPNFDLDVELHRCFHCGVSCKSCGKIFKNKRLSKAHTHHNLCRICGRKSLHAKAHEAHKNFHGSVAKFRCYQCQFGFTERTNFVIHNKKQHGIHIPDRCQDSVQKHSCSTCQKEFSDRKLLAIHIKLHGDKKFSCSVCDMAFITKTLLDFHIRRHMNDKAHCCSVCQKGFIRKTDLNRHEKIHEERSSSSVSCTLCDMQLKSKRNLQLHLQYHEKKENCLCYCGKRFLRKTHLKAHQVSSQHTNAE